MIEKIEDMYAGEFENKLQNSAIVRTGVVFVDAGIEDAELLIKEKNDHLEYFKSLVEREE